MQRLCEIEKKMPLEWSFYAQEIAACRKKPKSNG
jgi:hypothetical protein